MRTRTAAGPRHRSGRAGSGAPLEPGGPRVGTGARAGARLQKARGWALRGRGGEPRAGSTFACSRLRAPFGRALARRHRPGAALWAAASRGSPSLSPGDPSGGAAAASRPAWGARASGILQADRWGQRNSSSELGQPGSHGPRSETLAPGEAICRVTGFPRIVGSLWRGRGGVGAQGEVWESGALLAREQGHEFVKGGTESSQEP